MSDPNTLRILEIDGGGERGYLPLNFLKHFVNLWGIDPARISDYFDVICGTSVGGIMSLSLALGLTPDEMSLFFTDQGRSIFSLFPPPLYSVRPNAAAKVALILTNTPFYQSSGIAEDFYGSGLLYKTLQNTFGLTTTMQSLRTNVIIPSYEQDTQRYVLFSNLNYPEFIGQNELIYNVGLATGAAPVYLPPLEMNGHSYLDGGIYQNNPAQFGKTLAHMIKPNANRVCILSLGTGIGEMGFDPGDASIVDVRVENIVARLQNMAGSRGAGLQAFDSIQTIFGLFNIASVGGQESVARSLLLESKYTLNQVYTYRFQPLLDPDMNTELDNTDLEILTYYEETALQAFNGDIDNISAFLGHLTA